MFIYDVGYVAAYGRLFWSSLPLLNTIWGTEVEESGRVDLLRKS